MKIPGGANITPIPPSLARTYPSQTHSPAPVQKEDLTRRFDSVTISGGSERYGGFEMDLKSRLSREVRTATPSETVAALRDQVRSGEYRPDPREIARKMLLLGEAI